MTSSTKQKRRWHCRHLCKIIILSSYWILCRHTSTTTTTCLFGREEYTKRSHILGLSICWFAIHESLFLQISHCVNITAYISLIFAKLYSRCVFWFVADTGVIDFQKFLRIMAKRFKETEDDDEIREALKSKPFVSVHRRQVASGAR